MQYLHYTITAGNSNIVQVTLDSWANVQLLDEANYQNYINGRKYTYYGGQATVSPFNIRPPYTNNWHLVIDKGGYTGSVKASVKVI
jgi:hypothetical protein